MLGRNFRLISARFLTSWPIAWASQLASSLHELYTVVSSRRGENDERRTEKAKLFSMCSSKTLRQSRTDETHCQLQVAKRPEGKLQEAGRTPQKILLGLGLRRIAGGENFAASFIPMRQSHHVGLLPLETSWRLFFHSFRIKVSTAFYEQSTRKEHNGNMKRVKASLHLAESYY